MCRHGWVYRCIHYVLMSKNFGVSAFTHSILWLDQIPHRNRPKRFLVPKSIYSKMNYQKIWCHPRLAISLCFLLTTFVFANSPVRGEDFLDEPVETLDTIEVPATFVIQEERKISIPLPEMNNFTPLPTEPLMQAGLVPTATRTTNLAKVSRDPIADIKGKRTPVRPAKAERPPYPQFAREQGWEGTVVLRIRVNQQGSVDSVKTQKSSGFPILDDSALRSVKSWSFEPAKDGEFLLTATVDLPIRFDLDEP
jgi:TonB family protein